jgi:hypothetical protein
MTITTKHSRTGTYPTAYVSTGHACNEPGQQLAVLRLQARALLLSSHSQDFAMLQEAYSDLMYRGYHFPHYATIVA